MATATTSTEAIVGLESESLTEIPTRVGTVALSSALEGNGNKAATCSQSLSTNSYFEVVGFNTNGGHSSVSIDGFVMTFAFSQSALPSGSTDRELMWWEVSVGTRFWGLGLTSSGNITFVNASGSPSGTGTPISYTAGTVVRLGLKVYNDAGTQKAILYEDGVQKLTANVGTHSTIVRIHMGRGHPVTGSESTSYDQSYDNIVMQESATLHSHCDVLMKSPAGDGTYDEWPTGTFADSDERPPDNDTTFIGASTVTQRDTQTLPSGWTDVQQNILAVQPWAVLRRGFFAATVAVRLRSGSTDSDAGGVSLPSTYTGYGKVHFTDPDTASAWIQAGAEAAEVGAVVTVLATPFADVVRATQFGLHIACYGGFPSPRPISSGVAIGSCMMIG